MPSTTYRRFRKKETEARIPTHKLICFQIGKEQYAISISQVQYVLKEFTTQGTLINGHSLVHHNNEHITLIDVSRLFLHGDRDSDRNYVIVCNTKTNERIGIPIADIPIVIEIAEDKFSDLPTIYHHEVGYKGIQKLISTGDNGTLLYLDIEQLYKIAIDSIV